MGGDKLATWEVGADGNIYHYGVLLSPDQIYDCIVELESEIDQLETELKPYRYMFRPIIGQESAERIAQALADDLGGRQ